MKYVILLLLLFLAACSRGDKQAAVEAASAAPQPVLVKTAVAEQRKTDQSILVTGSLQPDETSTVVGEVAGRIVELPVDFGRFVRKGDLIAQLDETEYQLQLDRSKAALAQAMARLGLDPETEDIPTTTPAVRQATAQLEDAKYKFENAKRLIASGDISQERYTELEKAYRAREASLEASRDEMRTLWANVLALRVEKRLAEKHLNDTTIRAPFDGSISERKVAPGQYLKENTPIVTLVKAYPLRLRVEVPETAAAMVRPGTTLAFSTDAIPDAKLSAAISELNPGLNDQSRTLVAEARLNSTDSRLKPGMFVQVRLVLARNVDAVYVPKQAVYAVAGLTKIFVVRNGRVKEFKVAPGEMSGDWMRVPSDSIRPGEQVVISNLPQLIDGQEVRVGTEG